MSAFKQQLFRIFCNAEDLRIWQASGTFQTKKYLLRNHLRIFYVTATGNISCNEANPYFYSGNCIRGFRHKWYKQWEYCKLYTKN